jgi:hypothetical protein
MTPISFSLWLKALRLADDVGAGKTVEAGLVLCEMLLRRGVDFVLVAAPAGMVRQWQDDLEAKFGLAFTLIDGEHLATLRRERGYTANPWSPMLAVFGICAAGGKDRRRVIGNDFTMSGIRAGDLTTERVWYDGETS